MSGFDLLPGTVAVALPLCFVLSMEGCEGLLLIQCQDGASFINYAVCEEAKKKKSSISDKSRAYATYYNESKAHEVAGDGSHSSIRPSSHVKWAEVGEARHGQTSAPVWESGE